MSTKKDFEATARIISAELEAHRQNLDATDSSHDAAKHAGAIDALSQVAHRFADHYARENGRFDRGRFMKACGSVV